MRTLSDYVELAISRNKLRGTKHLSLELGLSASMVSQYLRGRCFPPVHVMARLADLCGVDVEDAVRDLLRWMSAKEWRGQRNATAVLKMMTHGVAVLLLALLLGTNGAQASMRVTPFVYYGK